MADPTFVAAGALGTVNDKSGTGGAITVPVPSGVLAGDTLVTVYVVGDSGKNAGLTPLVPSGWTTPSTSGQDYIKTTTSYYAWLAYVSVRTAGSSEPASYSFGCPVGSFNGGAYGIARMLAFRGGDGVLGAMLAAAYTSGSTFTFGSLIPTTSSDDWLAIALDASNSSAPNAPSGFTSAASGGNRSLGMSLQAAYKALSSSAATGTASTSSKGGFNSGSDAPGFAFSLIVDGPSAPSSNAATGTGTVTPSGSGTVQGSQTAAGHGTLAVVGAGVLAAVLLAQGVAPVSPSGSGALQQINPAQGVATVQVTGAGTAQASQAAAGAGTVTVQGSGTIQELGLDSASGTGIVQPTGTGALTQTTTANGTAQVPVQGTGLVVQTQRAAGSAQVGPSGSGLLQQSQAAAGTATVRPLGSGSIQLAGIDVASGFATIRPSGSGLLVQTQQASGLSLVSPRGAGVLQSVVGASGSGLTVPRGAGSLTGFLPAIGTASSRPLGWGLFVQWQRGAGVGLVAVSGSGTLANGNAYPVTPGFFLSMPARSFYVQMPARCFYLAMPGRCFYLQDDESMAAKYFPDAMDPLEDGAVTIDKTLDLGTNETLTGLSGQLEVTVTQGTDQQATTRFGTPVINAAQILADPPKIPIAIAAAKGLQIPVAQPVDGCWYLLRQACTTSTGRVVTLKGILQVTSK